MKKIFAFAAAAMAALTVNAEVYHFDNNAGTYSLNGSEAGNAFTATTYTMDGVEGFSVNYQGGSEKGYVYLAADGTVFFEYANSSSKNNVVKTGNHMFVCDSKNFVLNVKGLQANDEVYLLYSAKGSSPATLTNADNANTEVMADAVTENDQKGDNEGKNAEGVYCLTLMHVKAIANGGIKIKETNGGMRVFAIGINEVPSLPTGVAELSATKAVKTIENGQLVIYRAGKKFNAAGARL